MNVHDRIQEVIAAYAINAIDDDQRRQVEHELLEHLPGCPECSATMLELRETAGELGLGARPVAPSQELENRLLGAVRGEPRAYETAPNVSHKRRLVTRVGVAAAALALASSSALNVSLVRRADDADRERRTLSTLVELAADPRARTVALRGQSGSVALVYRPGASAVLVGESFPQPPAGHVYELWFLNGEPVPVRSFVPEDGRIVLELPKNPEGFRGAAITVEKGFVLRPTTPAVYSATLQA